MLSYDVGNPGLVLGQTQTCGRVKPVNGIPTLPSMVSESPTAIHI
jgi:hypothetical protein